ncbi:MAG TPA: NAD(P)/FAD-dependent oxidoreductase [Nitrososphaeraceae archaeon]|nr:NAD(P)/FAD-dependent oxidoreductase [Nitrososphaeraceae archaeon]
MNRPKHIIILGSGFAGIETLRRLQKKFKDDNRVELTLVSKDNFLLFTPMLPEVSVGMIETRDIITPVRVFCKKATFYQSIIKSIDLKKKEVVIANLIGNQYDHHRTQIHVLNYDYAVIALGGVTNFFGNRELERYTLTMKSIDDALILRNHIINVLEQASLEEGENKAEHIFQKEDNQPQGYNDDLTKKSLLTFVVVGGGFSGIETVGALNDFVRETITTFYKNIDNKDIRVVLIEGEDKIMSEVDSELGTFVLKRLEERGVEFILNTFVDSASKDHIRLASGITIPTYTIVWTAGLTVSMLIKNLECEHAEDGRILVNNYLQLCDNPRVYALGDCAYIMDTKTGRPYPPTAQHAIREGKIAAQNLITSIYNELNQIEQKSKERKLKEFNYKSRGKMAEIGKRIGVADIFGLTFKGFVAWWLWRTFYLAQVPTRRKKIKIILDWSLDTIFRPDVAMIKRIKGDEFFASNEKDITDITHEEKVEGKVDNDDTDSIENHKGI